MPSLGVSADHQRETDARELIQHGLSPKRRALGARRQIAPFAASRIAKSHGHDCHQTRVVEYCLVHPHPCAQTAPAGILKRDSGGVGDSSGRLARNQDSGLRMRLENRARAKRECADARPTRTHFGKQAFEIRRCLHSRSIARAHAAAQLHGAARQRHHQQPPITLATGAGGGQGEMPFSNNSVAIRRTGSETPGNRTKISLWETLHRPHPKSSAPANDFNQHREARQPVQRLPEAPAGYPGRANAGYTSDNIFE